jgi:AAA15 family ATPase/GTPase
MLMNEVGINISNFNFVKKADDDTSYDLIFEHTVNGKTYPLNINQESDGTQKLFNVLPLVIIALAEGRLLVIDELDAKLHPKLLKFIIMLFKNPEINIRNAQLIFTSHDVSIMKSSVFRTDEIWFACKLDDESSDLYSLYELRDENENHIQPSAAYDKQYLEGRYGADPYFRNMMDWK